MNDEAERFRTRTIRFAAWTITLVPATLFALDLALGRDPAHGVVIAGLLAAGGATLGALRAGRGRLAAQLLVWTLVASGSGFAALRGGVSDPTIFVYFVALVLSTWLLGRRSIFPVGLVCLAALGTLAFLQHAGTLLAAPPAAAPRHALSIATILALFTVIAYFAVREREKREQRLRDSEAMLASFFATSPEPLAITRAADGVYLTVNDAWCRAFGRAREAVLGRPALELGIWPNPADRARMLAALAERGELSGYETHFVHADGRQILTRVSCRQAEIGGEPCLTYSWRDVTEEKQAELALRESRRLLEAVVDAIPMSIFAKDLESNYVMVNRYMAEFFGTTKAGLLGHHTSVLPSRDDTRDRSLRDDQLVYRERRALVHEPWIHRADGTPVRFHSTKLPLFDAQGNLTGLLGINRDVTEERAAQSRIEELNASLEAKVEARTAELKSSQEALLQSEKLAALGRLVAGVAHELNTPIGNALLAASTAREHVEDFTRTAASGQLRRSELAEYAARAREASEILYRNLDRAGELIRSFKQVAADQTSSQRRSFALKEVVDEVLLAHHPILRKSPIAVAADVPESIRLDSYPGPLGQVLGNLIVNALLHGFEGRSEGRITVSARVDGADTIEIAVRDDGCGISEADQKMIFEPFFTTKLGRGGTGLGLAICHRLVTESLGGTLRVTSRLGQGTAFLVRIPVKAPAVAQREAA